jgi:hypothetical protein
MQTLPRQEGWGELQGVSALYNKATCFEFHRLLVATLLSYGKALDEYAAALKEHKKKPDLQEVVRKADEVWTCTSLLWSIAYSRILENHLGILRLKGWLEAPVNRDFSSYHDFTHFEKKDNQEIFTADASSASGLVGGDEEGSSTSDNMAGLADEDVEDGHEGEEISALYADEIPVGLADVYRRWIRLQVDRWHAIRILAHTFTNPHRSYPSCYKVYPAQIGYIRDESVV